MRFLIEILICCLLMVAGVGSTRSANAADKKSAILFCAPAALGQGYVDLDYLKELKAKGFEVDYTTKLEDLTWERIKAFNVLLLYTGAESGYNTTNKLGMKYADFSALIEKFLQAGGGVFLMIPEHHIKAEMFHPEMMEQWGFRIPSERIVEKDAEKLATQSRMAYQLAYTDQVAPSPVSAGVQGIWYPYWRAYNAQTTNPIWVDEKWQVVVKASPTTTTEKVDYTTLSLPIPNPFYYPNGPLSSPPIFAIREYGKGRIALISTWPQYSVGSGTRWLFDREVLSKGLKGKKSDFGQLLENSFGWLAEPSLRGNELGGFLTDAQKLEPPNYRMPEAIKNNQEISWTKPWEETGLDKPAPHLKMFRGLIGARSTHGDGTSTVAEYATAAKKLGLAFVIILDDFDKLTPQKLEALKADCAKYSDDKVRLFGGYTIENNIGNHLFCFGPSVPWPPDNVLTGPNNSQLMQQAPGAQVPALNWLLSLSIANNVGHYDFNAAVSKGGMRMSDCKIYSMAALRTYRNGKLVEDVTDEYLTTTQGTAPPGPVSFNEVSSVAEMEREVQQNHALTFAQIGSLETIFKEALRWTGPYDGINIFPSDGPIINAWPGRHRTINLGGQEFVTGRMLMPSLISLHSDIGLKEIRIFNGRNLYRRFLPGGAKDFNQLLILEGTVQKDMALIAEDVKGNKAVSYTRSSWKDGSGTAVIFCSDHVNDCKSPADGPVLVAHGPYQVAVTSVPQIPEPGETWDGGPAASKALTGFGTSSPVLTSDLGSEDGGRFNQTPAVEFTDEMGTAITSFRDREFDPKLPHLNPWYGFGPSWPTKLMEHTAQFRLWSIPTIGPRSVGWSGPGMRVGVQPSLHRGRIKFKQAQTIKNLKLLSSFNPVDANSNVFLVSALTAQAPPQTVELTKQEKPLTLRIETGGWFGIYSPQSGNSHLFINHGAPFLLNPGNPRNTSSWQNTSWFNISADMKDRAVKAGEEYSYELFSMSYPLDSAAKSADELIAMRKYLDQPDGLKILQGKRLASPGILDLEGNNYVAEFSVAKPVGRPKMTLPARITGLNRRWSAGLWLKKGYEKGDYGNGINRYTPLGIDSDGNGHIAAHTTWADETHIAVGHPVITGPQGKELFIQVTHVNENPQRWHVSVNNPTDKTITTELVRVMDLPGLTFSRKAVTLKPGEYLVLQ